MAQIVEARIYLLSIPFKQSFAHSLKRRTASDSYIVELTTDTGIRGYGEGVARPYVTGETLQESVQCASNLLLPRVLHRNLPDIKKHENPLEALSPVVASFTSGDTPCGARAAVELAIIDCLLREEEKSLSWILPPRRETIIYSGIIDLCSLEQTKKMAAGYRQSGFHYLKIKVATPDDARRVAAVRNIMGSEVSIRIDANGVFSVSEAIEFSHSVSSFNIVCFEQPVRPGNIDELAAVKNGSSIPVMADESVVTFEDAQELIAHKACDYFNLRIAKCGGIVGTLGIANLASQSGVKTQLGCLVGETAVLSAAGRHLAAYLPDIEFVEGSYSTWLLEKDISTVPIAFGAEGQAPILAGSGLGISVDRNTMERYAHDILHIV